ncbi:SpvB/TcaC N-terminal domain-containing protein [Streptosporangium sp. NPDC002721]|uniref:SpvB/TcaC N-terminal domain-containing protein n=1 Tax=Streptosporangium sp. NPDC002721 TaxID=3366188 RepID=UPI0036C44512
MRIWRRRFWIANISVWICAAVLIADIGVPGDLARPVAAATLQTENEQSVKSRPVPPVKVPAGAESNQPKPRHRDPVWPTPGRAEIGIPVKADELTAVKDLPIRVGEPAGEGTSARTSRVEKVKVETLSPETVRAIGGVGLGVRFSRGDGIPEPGTIRAQFSYAGFRDAFSGNFAGRLELITLPACVLETPRPKSCVVRPRPVKAVNDINSGTLTADVTATPPPTTSDATPALPIQPNNPANGTEKVAASTSTKSGAAQNSNVVYLLAAGPNSQDGSFTATDLKPSGAWQAGASGGVFTYDLPIAEPPAPAGNGPDLAFTYDASSIDGQGSWTNNQSGVVGAGWELNTGFIERRYRRCDVYYYYGTEGNQVWVAETADGGDHVCWESPDLNDGDSSTNDLTQSELLLHVDGKSAQIVKDRTSGLYKTVPDLGWKIESLTGAASGQDYWRLTSSDGTIYRFGYTRDASWQVPYVGNNFGEPCSDRYWADFSPPTCAGVWRWNLDQEIDRNENIIDYSYNRETNHLCYPSCFDDAVYPQSYDRGGFLSQVAWGHNTQVAGSVPTARMTLTTVDRGTVDVPTDLRCNVFSGCGNSAIAFFSTRKLSSILTESRNPTTSSWSSVNRYDYTQTWIYTRTDFPEVGPYDPLLWLDTVQQTGLTSTDGSPSIKLPPTDFDAVMLAGKMVYDDMSDWTSFLSWRMVPRIGSIGNGLGGRVNVTYEQADPCSGGKGRDGTNYFADTTGDCYKINQSIPGNTAWTVYFKQLVKSVTERDLVAGSPDMVTAYEYVGPTGWASPIVYANPFYAPPSTDWRGYGTVRILEGTGTDPSQYTVTTQTYLRGLGGTVANFEGGTTTDALVLQGQLLQEQKWLMTGYSPRTYSEVSSARHEYTITSTGTGPGVFDPAFVLPTRKRGRESVNVFHPLAAGCWSQRDRKVDVRLTT